jgi:hypothetical protein
VASCADLGQLQQPNDESREEDVSDVQVPPVHHISACRLSKGLKRSGHLSTPDEG